MLNNSAVRTLAVIALGLSLFLGWKGVQTYEILQAKTHEQNEITQGVHRWSQSYMALREVLNKWEEHYRVDDSIQDLMSLYAVIGIDRYGLRVDTDDVILNKVEPIIENGLHIGLTKICLISVRGSTDRRSLSVTALDYESLFEGIQKLADKEDIHIGSISIKGGGTTAQADLGEFCILLRTSQA